MGGHRRSAVGLARQLWHQQSNSIAAALDCSAASQIDGSAAALGGVRQASQLAVKQRMRSVTNIQKITKAMKMVAASKMRTAQARTEQSRGLIEPFVHLLGDHPAADVETNVVVPITSDKGLCGGINSSVTKYTRGTLRVTEGDGKNASIFVLGDKGRAQLSRFERPSIYATVLDTTKVRLTFALACALGEDVLKTEYDAARIIFNRFHSAISFRPTIMTVLSPDALEKSAEAGSALDKYEIEGPDRAELLQDLGEFQLACMLFNAMSENNCSENASRMQAMENSTKNASDMLEKLTLSYNRTRQAAITTELTEIISGAAALEG